MVMKHLILRVALYATLMLTLTVVVLPGSVYADDPPTAGGPGQSTVDVYGNECDNGNHTYNPHCTAPEAPFAVMYPIVGAAMFAGFVYLRSRRSEQLTST